MKITARRKLALFASAFSLLVLGGGSVFAATNIGRSSQDAANANLDAKAVAAAAPDCSFFSATNASGQRRVYTSNTATVYTNSAAWQNMQCGSFSVSVPRGKAALIVVKVDGEVTCTVAVSDSQWCQGRVIIDNTEGKPNAPEPDSFSWANSQTDPNAWESNAFTRTGTVRCPADHPTTICSYMVRAQVKNHAANMSFRVDDTSVDADVTYY